jgi:hypothetical protein
VAAVAVPAAADAVPEAGTVLAAGAASLAGRSGR